jgi:hypothetical protein
MTITVIHGLAGCGKSTYLANLICNERDAYVVLAYTHSAVENIYRKVCEKNVDEVKCRISRYKTIHSFFRIDYETNRILGPSSKPIAVYIDEFSLIPKEIFRMIMRMLQRTSTKRVYIAGDPLQLNGIQRIDHISFQKLRKIANEEGRLPSVDVLVHIHNSVYFTKYCNMAERISLMRNFRANSRVMQLIESIFEKHKPVQCISFDTAVRLLHFQGYSLIAGTYQTLERFNDTRGENNCVDFTQCRGNDAICPFRILHLRVGQEVLCIGNDKDRYYNGETLILTRLQPTICARKADSRVELSFPLSCNLPFTPTNLLTVHRAQGRTIPRVIVCIEDMFEITMLYTAITRASEDCLFYSATAATIPIVAPDIAAFTELRAMVYPS